MIIIWRMAIGRNALARMANGRNGECFNGFQSVDIQRQINATFSSPSHLTLIRPLTNKEKQWDNRLDN